MATYFIRVTWSFNPLLTSLISLYLRLCAGEIHQDSRHFQLAITYNKMSFISRQITLFSASFEMRATKLPEGITS